LPIPATSSPTRMGDLNYLNHNLGEIVEQLTRDSINASSYVHLDPDLYEGMLPRSPGWLPAFGQTGSSLSHLEKNGIGKGDLFLFFGWFREVELSPTNHWRFKSNAPNLHVIFGWLQVSEVLKVGGKSEYFKERIPWLDRHPHLYGDRKEADTIFVGSDRLSIAGSKNHHIPGGGMFKRICDELILSEPGQRNRSVWELPGWFNPDNDREPLTYHRDLKRWEHIDNKKVRLRSVAKGQEFILDMDHYPEAADWLNELFGLECLR